MTPFFERDDVKLYCGDCVEVLRSLPANLVQSIVTSPPYWLLRSYLRDDDPNKHLEIGSEASVEKFIETMVNVFREAHRVLRDGGTLFLNLGDTSFDDRKWGGSTGGKHVGGLHGNAMPSRRMRPSGRRDREFQPRTEGGQPQLIPHRVAMALQNDGWILRSTVVWAKPSPMPESVQGTAWSRCRVKVKAGKIHSGGLIIGNSDRSFRMGDAAENGLTAEWAPCPGCPKCIQNNGLVLRRGRGRPTNAHEFIFVFSKSRRYFWDMSASAEKRLSQDVIRQQGSFRANGGAKTNGTMKAVGGDSRNPRSVWNVNAEGSKVKHFAAYPSELVRRCLIAACSPEGCCAKCGAPYAPIVESMRVPTRPGIDNKVRELVALHTENPKCGNRAAPLNLDPQRHVAVKKTLGYKATCECNAGKKKQVVMDLFSGTGTTGQTARQLGHAYIGIDLSEEYLGFAIEKIFQPPRWWLRQNKPKSKPKPAHSEDRMLFE